MGERRREKDRDYGVIAFRNSASTFLDEHLKYRNEKSSIALFDDIPTKERLTNALVVFTEWLPSQSIEGMIILAVGKNQDTAIAVYVSINGQFQDVRGVTLTSLLSLAVAVIKEQDLPSLDNVYPRQFSAIADV
jgi:hypothetical protein